MIACFPTTPCQTSIHGEAQSMTTAKKPHRRLPFFRSVKGRPQVLPRHLGHPRSDQKSDKPLQIRAWFSRMPVYPVFGIVFHLHAIPAENCKKKRFFGKEKIRITFIRKQDTNWLGK